MVVYAYDDAHNPHQPGQPQRKFAFTPDQFTKHYSDSDLGASYSIWIPWDAVGGDQCQISLVPVFTATSGQVVMGQQAMNVLPGNNSPNALPEPQLPQLSSQEQSGIQPLAHRPSREGISAASFSSHTVSQLPAPRLRTSTIHLTPALQRRLSQNADVPVAQQVSLNELNATTRPVNQLPPIPTAFPPPQLPSIPVPTAASPDGPNPGPRPARFERSRFPVRGGLGGRQAPPAPWTPPYPAAPPSALQSAS